MIFKGTVTDRDGQVLVGAHVLSNLRDPRVATITDFNGEFIIGDARYEETWTIKHLGYHDRLFKIERNVPKMRFILEENPIALDEVVLTPNNGKPEPPIDTQMKSGFADGFNDLINNLPKKQKLGPWDQLKQNPLAAVGLGLLAFLAGGALLSRMARYSDRVEQKRLTSD